MPNLNYDYSKIPNNASIDSNVMRPSLQQIKDKYSLLNEINAAQQQLQRAKSKDALP